MRPNASMSSGSKTFVFGLSNTVVILPSYDVPRAVLAAISATGTPAIRPTASYDWWNVNFVIHIEVGDMALDETQGLHEFRLQNPCFRPFFQYCCHFTLLW
jgi:hypothetical protein